MWNKLDRKLSDTFFLNETLYKNKFFSFKDRILYRDKPTSIIECRQYKSVEGVKHSDHKPVIAHFHVKLKPGLNT